MSELVQTNTQGETGAEQEEQPLNPLFTLSEDEVRLRYERNEITPEEVQDWSTHDTLNKGGLYDMSEDSLRYAYDRGLVTEAHVELWTAYKNGQVPKGYNPSKGRGNYDLMQLAMGAEIEQHHGEAVAPAFLLDPTDWVVDFLTFGAAKAPKLFSMGVKEGAKLWARETGKDMVYGRIASGAMDGIDAMGGGFVTQMLGAITSPAAATVIATSTRRGLIELFKKFGKNNPQVLDNIRKTVDAVPEDPMSKKIQDVLGELGEKGHWTPADAKPKPKVDPEAVVDSNKVFDDVVENMADNKILKENAAEDYIPQYGEKLVQRLKDNGMGGHEIVDAINRVSRKATKKVVTDSAAEAKVQSEVKKLSNGMGMSKVRTERALQYAHDAKLSAQELNHKARMVNETLTSLAKRIDNEIDAKVLDVEEPKMSDVLEITEMIRVMDEVQEAFMGIRAEAGRTLRTYRDDQLMKNRFDFVNAPKQDLASMKAAQGRDMVKALKYFRKANGAKAKNRAARNLQKNRFLKGVLELEQAMLLSHWRTQVVNIVGSSMAAGNELAVRYAAINWRAWKEAGGWKKPFSRDELAMAEWQSQKDAIKQALVETLRIKGGWKGIIDNPREAFLSESSGRAWKAFWTSEPQLDRMMKYEGQSLGAIPDYLRVKGMKIPLGKIIRLPFHGLTAGDEIFKGLGYRMEMNRILFRQARDAGAKNADEVAKYMGNAVRDGVPREVHEAAIRQARYQTFTDELGTGALGKIEGVLNTGPGLVGRILAVPFYRVIVNIPKYAAQQTPLGLLARKHQEIFKAAYKGDNDAKQAAVELMARYALGTSVLATGVAMHQAGMITGRTPKDQREIHKTAGVQPYSFVGDNADGSKSFVDYNRIDPHAFLFGIGADLSAAYDYMKWYQKDMEDYGMSETDLGEVIAAYLVAFTEPLMNKTVAKSAKDLADFAMNEERKWDKFALKQVDKFYPRALDLAAPFQDGSEVLREARTLTEQFYKKFVPEKAGAMRHIIYGTPVEREDRVVGMLNKRTMDTDPVMRMFLRTGTNIKEPAQKGTKRGMPWEFTDKQYDEYMDRIAQSGLREHLTTLVEEIEASGTKDDAWISDQLRNTVSKWREIIRTEMLFGENAILTQEEIEYRLSMSADAAIGAISLQHKTARTYNFFND